MSLLGKLLAKKGLSTADIRKDRTGKVFRRAGVSDSPELRRIMSLPRRNWENGGMGGSFGSPEELVELLTAVWKTPQGTMRLRPVQAVALAELADFGGLLGPIRVSGGKTLLSFLAPKATEVTRALLLVPGALKAVTKRKWHDLSVHWQLPPVHIESYDMISKNPELLDELSPELIFADEAHKLKNLRAAVTRRVKRWMDEHPETIFVGVSGTLTNRSIHEYAHIAYWSLPKTCPIPKHYSDLVEWGLCLDEHKGERSNSLAPGALQKLLNEEERVEYQKDPLVATRRAFRRRLTETPGVVSTKERGVACSLLIRGVDLDLSRPDIDEAFHTLRHLWQTPDGHPFCEAPKLWAHCRELVCGFYYVWNPRPPRQWMQARKAWCQFVRHTLLHNRRGYDTEMQVANACKSGDYISREYADWLAVRDTFVPKSEPVWVHDVCVNYAAKWLSENPKGICWVEHRAFAERLSAVSGIPCFGQGGRDKKGTQIEDATGPVIATIQSNATGRELQFKWNRNLVVSCLPNGLIWEQLIGRTHRDGQLEDEVDFEVVLACTEQYFGFLQAIEDSRYQQESQGQPRKLCLADISIPSVQDVAGYTGARWEK